MFSEYFFTKAKACIIVLVVVVRSLCALVENNELVGCTLVLLRSVEGDASNGGVSNEAMGLKWEEHNESIACL